MWKWAQGAVAAVTGSVEPEYGAEAFQSVDSTVKDRNPYTPLDRQSYAWRQPPQSHVETQTFYFQDTDFYGFVQLIHSNPVNLMFTSQFTFLLCKQSDPDFHVWGSHRLENGEITDSGINFKADRFCIELNDDCTEYHFSGFCSNDIQVDLRFRCVGGGFKIGEDGLSRYGTDLENPWGIMRHIFWPRCSVAGTILVSSHNLIVECTHDKTLGLFVMAIQGMKPHHAASRWNFLNFQSKTLSVAVMGFTTPVSYGRGTSTVGGCVKDGKLLMTAVDVKVEHLESIKDEIDNVNWPVPSKIRVTLIGPKIDDDDTIVKVEVEGKVVTRFGRVDVMAELPNFVKRVASGLSGANPFIYQFHDELDATVTINDEVHKEMGAAFFEATFIS